MPDLGLLVVLPLLGSVGLFVERTEQARSCPDAAGLVSQVNAQMQQPGLVPQARPDAADVIVSFSRNGSWRAEVREGPAARSFEDDSPQCDAIAAAVGVALRLLVRTQAPAQQHDGARTSVFLGVGAMAPFLASFSGCAEAGVWWERRRFLISIAALGVAPSARALSPGSVALGAAGANARLGWTALEGVRLRLTVSLGLWGGAAWAQGSGYPFNRLAAQVWVAGEAAVWLRVRIVGPLGLFARLAGLVHLKRPAFEIDGVGPAFEGPLLGATGSLGAELAF